MRTFITTLVIFAFSVYAESPVITSTPLTTVDQGSVYQYTLEATDGDNDVIGWQVKNGSTLPVWLSLKPNAEVTTVAGDGVGGTSQDHQDPLQASFNTLTGVVANADSNLFVAEFGSFKIRTINGETVAVSTFAGSGEPGDADSEQGEFAGLGNIRQLAVDSVGDLYVSDQSNHKIRKIDGLTGAVFTWAGSGIPGSSDHTDPALAEFTLPYGIAVDGLGNVYVSESNKIRKIDATSGAVTTVAGSSAVGSADNVDPLLATFANPRGLAVNQEGTIYVVDANTLRRIDGFSGAVTTLAGTGEAGDLDHVDPLLAMFNDPESITLDAVGNLFIADKSNHKIRRLDSQSGQVSTFTGVGFSGDQDSPDALSASFSHPTSVFADNNDTLYVTDLLNHKIRRVRPTITLTGTPGNDDVGEHDICLVASDGESETEHCFALTVNNINDAPAIQAEVSLSVAQNSVYELQAIASDIDAGDELTFSIVNQPQWASFFTATGLLKGVPGNEDVGTTHNIEITVSDGALTASLPPFELTVTNINDAPEIHGSPATTVNAGEDYLFVPEAFDIDTGSDERLTFSISNPPIWADFDENTGQLSGTPTRADAGISGAIEISVSDQQAIATLPPFDLTVVSVNSAPVVNSQNVEVLEDGSVTIILTGEDADNDPLTFVIVSGPTKGDLWLSDNIANYTPYPDFYGTDHITVMANDGFADSPAVTMPINVSPVDDTSIALNDILHLQQNPSEQPYELEVLANDNVNDNLVLRGVFAHSGKVWIENNRLFFVKDSNACEQNFVSVDYVVENGEGKYAHAQVTLLFDD